MSPRYIALLVAWANWNGQRGTAKQIERIAKQLSESDLERMLAERGVAVSA